MPHAIGRNACQHQRAKGRGKLDHSSPSARYGACYAAKYAFPRKLVFRCENCRREQRIFQANPEIRRYTCRICGAFPLVLASMGKPVGRLRQARREVDLPEAQKPIAEAVAIPGVGEVPCFEAAGNCECEHAAGEHRQDGATELDSACFALAGKAFCECESYRAVRS
jgi:hypothetical protein